MQSEGNADEPLQPREAPPELVRSEDETERTVEDDGPVSGVVERLRMTGKKRVIGQRKRIPGLDATTVTDPALAGARHGSLPYGARFVGSMLWLYRKRLVGS